MTKSSIQPLVLAIVFYAPVGLGFAGIAARTVYILVRRGTDKLRYPWPKAGSGFYLLYILQGFALLAGLVLFGTALYEPATKIPVPDAGKVVEGYVALIVGVPFYGMNAWLLLSPALLLAIGLVKDAILQAIVCSVQLILCAVVWMTISTPDNNYPGSHDWFAAYCLIGIAYAIPSCLAFGQIGQLVHKFRVWRYTH